jgi:hypothetical protein
MFDKLIEKQTVEAKKTDADAAKLNQVNVYSH